ncbi:MAG: ParB-like nuclease domain protein [Firmicutes bacterium ADurb.Bin506]|nr:MAG: ParB-like nuclease domain protein [Firmicutes bacterium ADurb.Bin506]
MTTADPMYVDWVTPDSITPYDKNARIIPQAAIDKVATSISEFGWRQPIVVDEAGVILAGHTRLLAAKQLGLETVPVSVAKGLSPEQARAYRLMDNRANQESMWDHLVLKDELSRLSVDGALDPALTGFSDEEFAAFTQSVDSGRFGDAPNEFKTFDETIHTDCKCPHCGYEWKGGGKEAAAAAEREESRAEGAPDDEA